MANVEKVNFSMGVFRVTLTNQRKISLEHSSTIVYIRRVSIAKNQA